MLYLERMFNSHLNICIGYEGSVYRLNSQTELWMCLINRKKPSTNKHKYTNICTFSPVFWVFSTVLEKLHHKHLGTELLQNKLKVGLSNPHWNKK